MDEFDFEPNEFLEHLNYKLGPKTKTGLNTLVRIEPDEINAHKLKLGLAMAADEELHFMRQRQKNPNYQRQLHGWVYEEGLPPLPANATEYQRAYDLANSLSSTEVAKLIGGYGGIRGNKPTGAEGVELAANALYNASYGIDVLTGAPLNYKQNAGHLYDFHTHGQGPTRPEQDRVNKVFQETDGLEKLLLEEKTQDEIDTALLYSQHPKEMDALLKELPSSKRETSGWNPERSKMIENAKRWHFLKKQKKSPTVR